MFEITNTHRTLERLFLGGILACNWVRSACCIRNENLAYYRGGDGSNCGDIGAITYLYEAEASAKLLTAPAGSASSPGVRAYVVITTGFPGWLRDASGLPPLPLVLHDAVH